MPDVVTFDPLNLLIIEIDTGGDNEITAQEIYSEWKDWILADAGARLGFPQAFSQVGGDPITDVQNLGITMFLENRWRIRPSERDHKLTIDGNLFTREPGESIFVSTIGSFTVNTETKVSNLVDSSVARLDLAQILTEVYIDVANGEAGTDEGSATVSKIGSPTRPSNNIVDARTIADRDNQRAFRLDGSITLNQDFRDFRFTGSGAHLVNIINVNGFDVSNSYFDNAVLAGDCSGSVVDSLRCGLQNVLNLAGVHRDTGFLTDVSLAAGATTVFFNAFSEVAGQATPSCTFFAGTQAQFRNYSGGLRLVGLAAGNVVSVDLDPSHLIFDASCTGGEVVVRGTGHYTDFSGGAVSIVDTGLITDVSAHSALVYKSTTQTLDVAVWLERSSEVSTDAVAFTLHILAADNTNIVTITEATSGITLTAAGWYAGSISLTLQPQQIYFAIVSVEDSRGAITRTRAVISA